MREKKYQTTKAECQKKIDEMNNVCSYCGRKIIPIKTVDNSGNPTYWAGCYHGGEWGVFTQGVKKDVYTLAYKIILEDDLYLGMEKDENSDFDYLFRNGVNKVCGILRTIERLKTNKPRYTKTYLRKQYNKYYKS